MMPLNSLIEFDQTFTIKDGVILDSAEYAPSVWHDDVNDVEIESQYWEAFSVGYTGQYGYKGAVMHASEQLSGKLERDIISTNGTYALVAVEVFPDEDDECPEPAGWMILKMKD